jgi:formylglycine-generating enzyme required for sulfatase activity
MNASAVVKGLTKEEMKALQEEILKAQEVQRPSIQTINGMEFVEIPAGTFIMGSPKDEPGRYDDEEQHEVIIEKEFYLQTTPVTQSQWEAVMGNNPSRFKDNKDAPNCPVESVSWYDVQEFVKKLNAAPETIEKGIEYSLPTEAEWEYACRAGTTTPFWNGDCLSTDQANYDGNYPMPNCEKGIYRQRTTPVKIFKPNPWGLFDMHGNVWEWCQDEYKPYKF